MSGGPERVSRIDERCVVSSTTDIPFSRLHDDLLAMDERGGYCYSLNASAARVWELILARTSVGSICTVLCKEFDVDSETCLQDVSELLGFMREAGWIEVTDAAKD